MAKRRGRYTAKVETETEKGREVLYVAGEGFRSTRNLMLADKWGSKSEAEAAGRFYARLCNDASRDLGQAADAKFVGLLVG